MRNLVNWGAGFSKAKLLRLALTPLPNTTSLPIVKGPLRGKRWMIKSTIFKCWLGTYELPKQESIAQHIRQGNVFYDIGANVGFYTLLGSLLVGVSGHVYAFEPLARNVRYLRRHIDINHLMNVTVYEAAVAEQNGFTQFQEGPHHAMGKIAPRGAIKVQVCSLDCLVEERKIRPPDALKIDVEGAEYDVLRGAHRLLVDHRPLIYLATHGLGVHERCMRLLSDMKYGLISLTAESLDQTDEVIAFPAEKDLNSA